MTTPTPAASSAVGSLELAMATTYQKARTPAPAGADVATVRQDRSFPRTAPQPSVERTATAPKAMVGRMAQPGTVDVPRAASVRNNNQAPKSTSQTTRQTLAQRGSEARRAGTHAWPFQRQCPSGEVVGRHTEPSNHHRPSGLKREAGSVSGGGIAGNSAGLSTAPANQTGRVRRRCFDYSELSAMSPLPAAPFSSRVCASGREPSPTPWRPRCDADPRAGRTGVKSRPDPEAAAGASGSRPRVGLRLRQRLRR
ncbi:hypothetical protein FB474_1052 [Oryzihumus leptocrescens]|uniref:Uncharacterized protein n=1 Tax=Oryzihumus leptocrescens TaxID=297536 RepID=A0A542ZH64_9MICO|nr:hypothetical protein FB474_1052 [Oryzihumus leptocrescens]